MTDHWPWKYHLHPTTVHSHDNQGSKLGPLIKLYQKVYQKLCQKVSKNDTTIPILMVQSELGETVPLTLQNETISVNS